jgi:hypothetical protein
VRTTAYATAIPTHALAPVAPPAGRRHDGEGRLCHLRMLDRAVDSVGSACRVYDGAGMCNWPRCNASGWIILCLVTLPNGFGCGRGRLGLGSRDAGAPDRVADVPLPTDQPTGLRDAGLPDLAPGLGAETRDLAEAWDVATEASELAADAGLSEVATVDAGNGADACIPIGCHDPICVSTYCGKIGDGCGGTLDCGNQCPAGQMCAVAEGLCRSEINCVALTCDNGTPSRYCGDIGDGCGGALHCGTDCGRAGWVCENHICVGRPPACELVTCDTPAERLCGKVADGCGGILDCGLACPQAGWFCSSAGRCVGGRDCVPASCSGPSGEEYCQTIGDGCGSRLECSRSCSASALTCRDNLCVATVGCPTVGCVLADGGHYCGVIGDGCGGAQDCGATCSDGSACGSVRANECGAGTSSPPPAPPKRPLPAPPVPVPGWRAPVPPPPPLCLTPPPVPQP